MDQVLNLSKKFWRGLEAADVETMRSVCDPLCYFVHIGGNFGDTAIVISDVDYGLLLDGKPTTHHFATTEVFHKNNGEWKLIQFTFTALVY